MRESRRDARQHSATVSGVADQDGKSKAQRERFRMGQQLRGTPDRRGSISRFGSTALTSLLRT
jgi:hypothetical protein